MTTEAAHLEINVLDYSLRRASRQDLRQAFMLSVKRSWDSGPAWPRDLVCKLFADEIAGDPVLRRIAVETAILASVRSDTGASEDEIDRLYAEIRTLRAEPPSGENEARYQGLLKRLRAIQHDEALRIERLLTARSDIHIGAVDEALRRADELITRYENPPGTDPSARGTDP